MEIEMTKFEFLSDLSRLIVDLPEEDREQAMEYYEDYFTDAGPEREQEIIKDFKSPAYIAEQLHEAYNQRIRKSNINSINATTAKADKKQMAEKQTSADGKSYSASLYSSQKKAIVILLFVITSPITLTILGIILGLFLFAIAFILCLVMLGITTVIGSFFSLLLCILSLLTSHIANFVFALGFALLLFTAGSAICYLDYKIFTRGIPSAYYSIMVQIKSIKSRLSRFTMK